MSSAPAAGHTTADLVQAADDLLAYGGQHRMLQRRFYEDPDGVFPRFAVEARGFELVDSDGRTFVDWLGGGGPLLLGYRHPAVEDAIAAQLSAGPTLSLMHSIELEVAAQLVQMIPCAETVAFGKNGSDAVTAAVRIARATTGREVILQHGVHGFHDWYVALHRVPGVPSALTPLVSSFPYNDIPALEALFDRFDGKVAAVVMEPVNVQLPEPDYLQQVVELAHDHGAIVVFDEMVTGFRLANGGAQELFGVTPDLACFGKGLANGMPLSAVVGRSDLMHHLRSVAYGMTFRGETLSLAAANAVLETLEQEGVAEHLAEVGQMVRAAFETACRRQGISAELKGPPARMTFEFADHGCVPGERLEAIFLRECARNGVLTNGNILPFHAHDADAVARTEVAFEEATKRATEAVEEGRAAIAKAVRVGFENALQEQKVINDGAPSFAGSLDLASDAGGRLVVHGWLMVSGEPADLVEVIAATGHSVKAETMERPDLSEAFPASAGADGCGFAAVLPASEFLQNGGYRFSLVGRKRERVIFRCEVIREIEARRPLKSSARLGQDQVLYL